MDNHESSKKMPLMWDCRVAPPPRGLVALYIEPSFLPLYYNNYTIIVALNTEPSFLTSYFRHTGFKI